MNPQATKIYNILLDGNWHCPIEWNYADGHCKRITDINSYLEDGNKGQEVIGISCDCGRHTSRGVKKRRLVLKSPQTPNPAPQTVFRTTATLGTAAICTPDKPCFSKKRFKVCSCIKEKVKDTLW